MGGTLRISAAGPNTGLFSAGGSSQTVDPSGGAQGTGTPTPTTNDPLSVLSGATVRAVLRAGNLRPVEMIEIYMDHTADHSSNSRAPDFAFVAATKPLYWNGVTYTPLSWGRGQKTAAVDRSTDSLSLELDDISQTLGVLVSKMLLSGAKARVVRTFVGSMGVTDAFQVIFLGKGKTPEFNEGRMGWELVSYINVFNTETPRRLLQRACNYQFGDVSCKAVLTSAANTKTGTAGASSSATCLVDAAVLTQADADYWDVGWVEVTSGPDTGVRRPILRFDPATDSVYFRYPFPSTLASKTYKIVRGCNKTKVDCDTRHDNLINYGGFAEVPRRPNVPTGGGV